MIRRREPSPRSNRRKWRKRQRLTSRPSLALDAGAEAAAPAATTDTFADDSAVAEDEEALADEPERKRGFFNPFKLSLGRTRQLFGRVNESLAHEEITEDLWGWNWRRH